MNNVFVTSDLHLFHNKSFIYEPRNFNSVEEMNTTIVNNWNSVVSAEDDVYVLGDLMLNDNERGLELIKTLNGKIHVIRGNHDTNTRMELYKTCDNIVEVCEAKFLKHKKQNYFLSHFPCLTSNCDEDKPLNARIISICGHSHVKDVFADWDKGLIVHAEMDTNNCTPWLLDTLYEKIKEKVTM